MASIYKFRDKWRAQIFIDGIRYSKLFDTKREAEKWVGSAENTIQLDKGQNKGYKVKDLFERYIDEVTYGKRAVKYEIFRIKQFLSSFPNLKLNDVTKEHVNDWIVKREKQVSSATVIRELNIIKNAFKIAHERWDWINHNPFKGSKTLISPPPRDRILTWSEIKALLKQFDYPPKSFEKMKKTQEIGIIMMIALRTALRQGEILQLGTGNVDFKKRIITIVNHKTMHQTGKPRIVPISLKTVKLLSKLPKRENYFFIKNSSLGTIFRDKRDLAGLKDLHFHDTRATALTMLSKYLDAMDLAKVSGHKDLNILLNTYYREKPEDIALKMDKKIR